MTISESKPDLVIWTGPVWAGNLAGVQWSHLTEILALPCTGSDGCAALAVNLPKTGTLQALLKSRGKSVEDYDKIILSSFSAGHGLCQIILSDEESREQIACFGAFDSYYTGALPGIKKGYLAFAKMAAYGEGRLMWTSSSNFPDRKWLSCEDSIKPLLDAIGPEESELPGDLSKHLKKPVYVVQKEGYVHANFGTTYAHVDHAKVVAPAVMQDWFSPMAHGFPSGSLLKKGALVFGGLILTFGGWKLGKHIRRWRS